MFHILPLSSNYMLKIMEPQDGRNLNPWINCTEDSCLPIKDTHFGSMWVRNKKFYYITLIIHASTQHGAKQIKHLYQGKFHLPTNFLFQLAANQPLKAQIMNFLISCLSFIIYVQSVSHSIMKNSDFPNVLNLTFPHPG